MLFKWVFCFGLACFFSENYVKGTSEHSSALTAPSNVL